MGSANSARPIYHKVHRRRRRSVREVPPLIFRRRKNAKERMRMGGDKTEVCSQAFGFLHFTWVEKILILTIRTLFRQDIIRTFFFAVLKHFKIDPHQTYQKTAWKQLKAARSNNRSLSAGSSLVAQKIGLLWFESSLVGPKLACCDLNHQIWIIGSFDHLK